MKKSKKDIIIEALQSGDSFSLSELTAHLSEAYGEDVKSRNVSPVLSALGDKKKTEIGYFIQKRKKPKQPNKYKLVDEACEMPIEELIDLSRKNGKDRFTLQDAVEKYPELQKYVDKFSSSKDAAVVNEKMVQPEPPVDQEQELCRLVRELIKAGIQIDVNVNIRMIL